MNESDGSGGAFGYDSCSSKEGDERVWAVASPNDAVSAAPGHGRAMSSHFSAAYCRQSMQHEVQSPASQGQPCDDEFQTPGYRRGIFHC